MADEILDLTGKTEEQIADLLNTTTNSIAKLSKQQAADLLKTPDLIEMLSDPVVVELKEKLKDIGEDLSDFLEPLELIESLGKDVLKQKLDIQSLISADKALDLVKSMGSANFEQITTNLSELMGTPQIVDMVKSIGNDTFGPILKKIDLLDGLPMNSANNFGLSQAITSGVNGPIGGLIGQLQGAASGFLKGQTGLGNLSNLVDVGFGYDDAVGGLNNDGNFRKVRSSYVGDPENTDPDDDFNRLSSAIASAASQDWSPKGSPANPLHAEAFGLSGRSNDSDGSTGLNNWNAPFMNYVLSKAGLQFIETISAVGYVSYGSTSVNFNLLSDIRLNDIAVFKSAAPVALVGFVKAVDPAKNTITVLAGNINGGVGTQAISLDRANRAGMRVISVRRNWKVPEVFNKPLFDASATTWHTGAGQPTRTPKGPRFQPR